MAGRHVPVHDLRELLRHLQSTVNDREVQRATGLNRRTIARYRAWASQQALLDPAQALPPLEELQQFTASTLAIRPPPQTVSSLEPHRDLVLQLHAQGVEGAAIRLRLSGRGDLVYYPFPQLVAPGFSLWAGGALLLLAAPAITSHREPPRARRSARLR